MLPSQASHCSVGSRQTSAELQPASNQKTVGFRTPVSSSPSMLIVQILTASNVSAPQQEGERVCWLQVRSPPTCQHRTVRWRGHGGEWITPCSAAPLQDLAVPVQACPCSRTCSFETGSVCACMRCAPRSCIVYRKSLAVQQSARWRAWTPVQVSAPLQRPRLFLLRLCSGTSRQPRALRAHPTQPEHDTLRSRPSLHSSSMTLLSRALRLLAVTRLQPLNRAPSTLPGTVWPVE